MTLTKKKKEQAPTQQNELITVREVARQLNVEGSTVRRWIKNGSLEAVELPSGLSARKSYRIKRSVLDAILEGATSGTN